MNKNEVELLKKHIKQSFWDNYYPGNNNIVLTGGPNEGFRGEEAYIFEYFVGRKWHKLTMDDFIKNYRGPIDYFLSDMSDSAFIYYLPALMLMVMTGGADKDKLNRVLSFEESLVSALRPKNNYIRQFKLEDIPLSLPQKNVVARFLSYLKENGEGWQDDNVETDENDEILFGPEYALRNYWGQFLEIPFKMPKRSKKAEARYQRKKDYRIKKT